jgi:cbb3-type cytochrome oxidase subunit 3
MDVNFAQNWPVFILLGAFITLLVCAFISGRRQEKINKEAQNKDKVKDKEGKL